MLLEVDRICKKCDIQYNIIAGTLLGAVRHKGFIPWDDDADVAMLRPEYEKFCQACQTELDTTRFYFQEHRFTKGYRWGYGKLRRKNTLFLREYQEHMPYEQGIFIDIFPLDNVPDNYGKRCLHNFHCFCIRKILWSKVGQYADKKWYKRIIYKVLNAVFSEKKVLTHYNKFIRASNRYKSDLVRILLYPTPNNVYGYYRVWYENSEKILFEKFYFSGIADYDAYLSFKFGDYEKLPPYNARKIHPVVDIKVLGSSK